MKKIIGLAVMIAVAVFLWKEGRPWIERQINQLGISEDDTPTVTCAAQAESASLAWGSGIGRFVNPPVDESAWNAFRSRIDGQILQARGYCKCSEPSCARARQALGELEDLVRSFDAAVRNGSPPGMDAVTRQESLDLKIEEAMALAKQGK